VLPHLPLLLVGAALGSAAAWLGSRLDPPVRAWVLPAGVAAAVALDPGPGLAAAVASWDLGDLLAVGAVALAALTSALAAGAAVRLGPTGAALSLVAVALAVVAAVPDTEGPVALAAFLAPLAVAVGVVERRRPGGWAVPAGAAAMVGAGVTLVGLAGSTAGADGALGAWGCVFVLAGSAATRRVPGASPSAGTLGASVGPVPPAGPVASFGLPVLVGAVALAVARTAAADVDLVVVAAVTAAGTAVVALAARFAPGRSAAERPR
jgi:hypothetical protein